MGGFSQQHCDGQREAQPMPAKVIKRATIRSTAFVQETPVDFAKTTTQNLCNFVKRKKQSSLHFDFQTFLGKTQQTNPAAHKRVLGNIVLKVRESVDNPFEVSQIVWSRKQQSNQQFTKFKNVNSFLLCLSSVLDNPSRDFKRAMARVRLRAIRVSQVVLRLRCLTLQLRAVQKFALKRLSINCRFRKAVAVE